MVWTPLTLTLKGYCVSVSSYKLHLCCLAIGLRRMYNNHYFKNLGDRNVVHGSKVNSQSNAIAQGVYWLQISFALRGDVLKRRQSVSVVSTGKFSEKNDHQHYYDRYHTSLLWPKVSLVPKGLICNKEIWDGKSTIFHCWFSDISNTRYNTTA